MLIQLNAVSRFYQMGNNRIAALNQIRCSIAPGEFVAVMGPSGSGKSTLLNVIGCLHKPSGGQYLLEGVDIEKLSDNDLALIRSRKIGFVFQTFNLFPYMTALQNVQVPLIYLGCPKKQRVSKAGAALEKVGLKTRSSHKPGEMSGGQQQRVAIARALVGAPKLLLADEPTGNLDSASGHEIMALFSELNKKGTAIIMVTHQQSISKFAERVIELEDGRIVKNGPSH